MINCFTFVREHLKQSGIDRIFPSFLKELDCYEDYFATHALISRSVVYEINREKFQAIINWNGSSLFSLEWDISGIINGLKEAHFTTTKISKAYKRIFFDESNVKMSRAHAIVNTPNIQRKPILLVWMAFLDMYYVIDGNHRFTAFSHSKQETIDAIILPAGFHLKYMLSEESRMRYKIFHNISIMQDIYRHPGFTVSEEMDDRNSLYSISDNKIRVTSFQRALLYFKSLYLRWRSKNAGAHMRDI